MWLLTLAHRTLSNRKPLRNATLDLNIQFEALARVLWTMDKRTAERAFYAPLADLAREQDPP